ncbi:MAG: flavoprotein [Planctomycetota bacterium]|jgi:phosphopantothenoylcysteine decarboxylase/phosphopantothenate--cysteine ligase
MPKEKTYLGDLHVLLGVSGGIAAYKAVDLAGKLTAAGAEVNTVMTENACRLIGPKSFEAITNSAVLASLWSPFEGHKISHITLVDWADIVVVAPATANIIGKLANGICDDLLSTVLCVCWAKPVLLAPAMNDNMWNNPSVQRNVKRVQEMGFELTGPQVGPLACGREGIGRMSEAQNILEAIEKTASKIKRNKK